VWLLGAQLECVYALLWFVGYYLVLVVLLLLCKTHTGHRIRSLLFLMKKEVGAAATKWHGIKKHGCADERSSSAGIG